MSKADVPVRMCRRPLTEARALCTRSQVCNKQCRRAAHGYVCPVPQPPMRCITTKMRYVRLVERRQAGHAAQLCCSSQRARRSSNKASIQAGHSTGVRSGHPWSACMAYPPPPQSRAGAHFKRISSIGVHENNPQSVHHLFQVAASVAHARHDWSYTVARVSANGQVAVCKRHTRAVPILMQPQASKGSNKSRLCAFGSA